MILDWAYLIHYCAIGLAVAINSVSVGIGEGATAHAALSAINTQPHAKNEIMRVFIVGMALVETAAVTGLTIAIMLMGTGPEQLSPYAMLAHLGAALAICLAGGTIGITSAWPSQAACTAVARQPFFSSKIQNIMLLTQSLMQTPVIFAFIVASMIKNSAASISTLSESVKLIASGLCMGVGSIGPALGLGAFAFMACKAVSINRDSYGKILGFSFISQAIIETPLIFALVTSLIILARASLGDNSPFSALILLAAALCTGIGTIAPAISSGKTASSACKQIAMDPRHYGLVSKASILCQTIIDTAAIYALVVSLLLIFF